MSLLREGPHIVIGGGVAGLSAARELALRGSPAIVVERGSVGARSPLGAATAASIGVLAAPRRGGSPLRRLQARAHRAYPELAARLESESGERIGLERRGALHLFEELPPPGSRAKRESVYRDAGASTRWLDGSEVRGVVPGISGRYGAGLLVEDEAVVDPRSLSRALLGSCERAGVRVIQEAGSVRIAAGTELAVELPGGDRLRAEAIVIAAGSWSASIDGLPATPPPVRPIRGQAIEVALRFDRGPDLRFRPHGMDREYHVVPRGGGRAWVGSTVEDVGFAPEPTGAGLEELLRAARSAFPDLRESDVLERWAGLRPQALRLGGPFVGPVPGAPGIWAHCGHYRSGILLAPLTASLLVGAMLGGAGSIDPGDLGGDLAGILDALRLDR